MSDFRAYGRDFTFDTKTKWILGQDDAGVWCGPKLKDLLVNGRYIPRWKKLNLLNPIHLYAIARTYATGKVAFLEELK